MKIIASFDDGSVEDLQIAEIMKKYNIETIFYFPVHPTYCNEAKGRKSLDVHQRRQIANDFEIGSHTLTHPLLTRVSLEEAFDQIFKSKQMLEDEFDKPVDAFCYPRGYANPDLQKAVQEAGYTHARGVNVGYIDESENKFYEQTTVHVGNNRKEYAGLGWFDFAIIMFERAKEQDNSVFHFWGHGWELAQDPDGISEIERLCRILTGGKD